MKDITIKELEEGVITIDDYIEENIEDEGACIYPYISIKTLLKEAYEDGAILELE